MNHCAQIEAAIRATVFHSPTIYSWFGNLSPRLAPAIKRELTAETARNYLLFNLQFQLYHDFYCAGVAAPARHEAVGFSAIGMTPFAQELSAANSGEGYWESGWKVRATEDEKVVVRKGGLELRVHPEDCLIPEGSRIAPSMELCLHFPKDFLNISPGFYMALSNKELTQEGSRSLLRVYWNLTAQGAVPFMRSATSMLNRANVPFKLKALNDPTRFTRCDSVVLYMRKSDYDTVTEILQGIYLRAAINLKKGVPALTKPLAQGVGLAEDPGRGRSFGLHRCRLLADGMIRAYEHGKKLVCERLKVVEDRFAEDGISLERPYLRSGSNDDYHFRPGRKRSSRLSQYKVKVPYAKPSVSKFLRTAHQIGQRLSQEAVWHQDRCNWLGAAPVLDSRSGQSGMTYGALGADLYSGTSGIALFLAELHAATGDSSTRRTALGAMRQALSRVDALPASSRVGFYTGGMGIAFAAVRVGIILGEAELLEHATQLLQGFAREPQGEREFDLLSGKAGAIAVLMVLRDILHDAPLLDFAVRLGDELLQTADATEAGYSWKSPTSLSRRNLTGFSHGTAGVAYALLELFRGTGDWKYRVAAERAFEYERHWFDAEAANWPDFREEPGKGRQNKRRLSFATFWCHGAPGIALSRLRAYEILKDETCKAEATTALQTTRQMIETWLYSGTGNFSLCHGFAGNAEVLLYGYQVLAQERSDGLGLTYAVANTGIETYAKRNHSWPCGTGGGETPSLMLGLAGIGYFYLRLHSMAIPSILILKREKHIEQSK
jgi:hypothetical protein